MSKKFVIGLFLVVVMLVMTTRIVSAAPHWYLNINNGSRISVNANERPQIVVQFGNRGTVGYVDRIECDAVNTDIDFVPGSFQRGPFLPPVLPRTNDVVIGTVSGQDVLTFGFNDNVTVRVPQGQNFNAAFQIVPANGTLVCRLYNIFDQELARDTLVVAVR